MSSQVPEHDALLSAAIDRQPMAVFIVRLDGADALTPPIVYVNEAFCTLTGYTKAEIADGTYPRIIGPETDRDLIVRSAQRVAQGEYVVTEVAL